MAETLPQTFSRQISGFATLPMPQRIGFGAAVLFVVVLAVTLANWGMTPDYRTLMPGLSERDKAQAIAALTQNGIPYRLNSATGALEVPVDQTHEARLHLATEGLPRAEGVGFELLDQDTGIGTSRMMENTRYQRALEGELARSVTTLNSVDSARVHLALPKQSVFVRDRKTPSASVLVNLHPGRTLDEAQVAGIVHLVASSVAELEPERVTIVDQRGRMLSRPDEATGSGQPARQLEYTRELEASFRERVQSILAPLVGDDGLRVQVTADVDFTQVESTLESFGDEPALRSEQLQEEESRSPMLGGVPGSLTNQPPGAGQVVAPGTLPNTLEQDDEAAGPGNRSSRSVRNYEVDRTIRHTRQAPASLQRLSVAVVVDNRLVRDEQGNRVSAPRDAAELDYLTALVKQAVGFDAARGDQVNLVNASFREVDAPATYESPPIWQETWFRELVKQGLAALGVLLLMLMVLRPALRRLAQPGTTRPGGQSVAALTGQAGALAAVELEDDSVTLGAARVQTMEDRLQRARAVAKEDPRLVAQVVRQWIGKDE